MRSCKPLLITFTAILIVLFTVEGFAQAPAPATRIPHQVVINGQRMNGTYVIAPGGGLQSFTCDNPQQFATPDGSSQGWACYEQATGTWLLNALPPAQVQSAPSPVPVPQQQPAVVYQQAPVVVYQQAPVVVYQAPPVYYSYPSYSYPRYPVYSRPAYVYRPSVVIGAAAINAAGRIAAAAIRPGYGRAYGGHPVHGRGNGHR